MTKFSGKNKQIKTKQKQTQKQELRYSVRAEICKTRRKHENTVSAEFRQ